ncbi:MAG: Mut7-C RNAse domain-containing protein [Candidatus Cyclobacteriaceae bacterium M2_1C_046]
MKEVPKEEVKDMLPPKTKQFFDEFYQCSNCKLVYWKGSHYEKMMQTIEAITGNYC